MSLLTSGFLRSLYNDAIAPNSPESSILEFWMGLLSQRRFFGDDAIGFDDPDIDIFNEDNRRYVGPDLVLTTSAGGGQRKISVVMEAKRANMSPNGYEKLEEVTNQACRIAWHQAGDPDNIVYGLCAAGLAMKRWSYQGNWTAMTNGWLHVDNPHHAKELDKKLRNIAKTLSQA